MKIGILLGMTFFDLFVFSPPSFAVEVRPVDLGSEKFVSPESLFISLSFNLYVDAGKTTVSEGGPSLLKRLDRILPQAIETGVSKGKPADNRYLKFLGAVGSQQPKTYWIHISSLKESFLRKILGTSKDKVKRHSNRPRGFSPSDAFESMNYRVYIERGSEVGSGGSSFLLGNLSSIYPESIEKGVPKGDPLDDRYLRFLGAIKGETELKDYWIHISAVKQKFLDDFRKRTDISWGSPLQVEAYNKNLAVRESWFDKVTQFIDFYSTEVKKIIASDSLPTHVFKVEESYAYLISDQGADVLNENGEPTGESLLPGTLVAIKYTQPYAFDKSEKQFLKSQEQISPLIWFETQPIFFGETQVKGYIHLNTLGASLYPLSDLNELKQKYQNLIPKLQERFQSQDDQLTIDLALRQFHNSICTSPGDQKQLLLEKWNAFIDSKTTARSRQVAINAYHVDIVARTILGERQTKKHLYDQNQIQKLIKQWTLEESGHKPFHPGMVQCQKDIIALSIRNRAFSDFPKSYYVSEDGDFAGAASAESQYHLWKDEILRKRGYLLTSCLYNQSESYRALKVKTLGGHYPDEQKEYSHLAHRIPRVLGMEGDEGQKAPGDGGYLSEIFQADPNDQMTEEERLSRLTNFRHYYHPNNSLMDRKNLIEETEPYLPTTVNGWIRVVYKGHPLHTYANYFLVTNGQVSWLNGAKVLERARIRKLRKSESHPWLERGDKKPYLEKTIWDFQVFVKGRWIEGSEHFKEIIHGPIVAQLLEYDLKQTDPAGNHSWVGLPNAVFPQCFKDKGGISDNALENAIRVPISWFDLKVRSELVQSFNEQVTNYKGLPNQLMGGGYYRVDKKKAGLASEGGEPIQIRCIDGIYFSPEHRDQNQGFPQFGGYCDPNITMTTGTR